MHKLEIKLKQHTPLIHFQHDQDNFTLRASEVKPKLDKFIIRELKESREYENGITEGWIKSKNGKEWLDYKMRIEAADNPYCTEERIVSVKRCAFLYKYVIVNIYSHSETLRTVLTENLCSFFVVTNFGLRQSKGYGSFTVEEIKWDGVIQPNYVYKNYADMLKAYFSIVYIKSNIKNVRQTIETDYKWLKAGNNPPNGNGYKKSLLFCYAVNNMTNHPRWEKRFFKQKIRPLIQQKGYELRSTKNFQGKWNAPIKDAEGNQGWPDTPTKYDYAYIRALLGMSEHFDFQLTKGAKAVVKIDGGADLQRFKSPIQFKVIENDIYMIGKEPIEILGKEVSLSYELMERNYDSERKDFNKTVLTPNEQSALSLNIPKTFSLSDFLSKSVKYINYKKCE